MHKIIFTKDEIEDLMDRFIAGELPKPEWTHQAHLISAVWHLIHFSQEKSLELLRERIKKHNKSVGTPNSDSEGYHETLTRFWLWAINEYIRQSDSDSLAGLCNALLTSEIANRNYPFKYYTKEYLFSVKARKQWMHPDLMEMSNFVETGGCESDL